ncbi:glyoxalase [Klebsiella pneumoniae]|nr:glyoxalase [Klebsiella pneumoniae]
MSITGIEKLEFGVDDLNHSAKFMRDFGLTGDASGRAFTTLSGARVELNPTDAANLPPAFEAGNTLRRMTWGVAESGGAGCAAPEAGTPARFP